MNDLYHRYESIFIPDSKLVETVSTLIEQLTDKLSPTLIQANDTQVFAVVRAVQKSSATVCQTADSIVFFPWGLLEESMCDSPDANILWACKFYENYCRRYMDSHYVRVIIDNPVYNCVFNQVLINVVRAYMRSTEDLTGISDFNRLHGDWKKMDSRNPMFDSLRRTLDQCERDVCVIDTCSRRTLLIKTSRRLALFFSNAELCDSALLLFAKHRANLNSTITRIKTILQ